MKRTINFLNRTKEQLYKAYKLLKTRYKGKTVSFYHHVVHGLLTGYFLIS